MKRSRYRWAALTLSLLLLQACGAMPARFERELTSAEGVEGEIHGAYPELELYVFTYRNPKDFFEFLEVSLIAPDAELATALAAVRRHDRVRIKGELMENRSPQPHVELSSLEVVKKHEPTPEIPDYDYHGRIRDDLRGKDDELFLVHAVHADGKILVVEHKDIVLPIFVRRPELASDLARNDVVRLWYDVRSEPDKPVHLRLDEDLAEPVEVVESVMALHGKPAFIEGPLVLFPKSPQVRFNVFAVLQELPGGLQRQYTLVNFDSQETFEKIRDKLQQAWDTAADSAVSGRNKLISTKVRVRARGRFNQVDPNQANVQIVLEGPEAVEIVTD